MQFGVVPRSTGPLARKLDRSVYDLARKRAENERARLIERATAEERLAMAREEAAEAAAKSRHRNKAKLIKAEVATRHGLTVTDLESASRNKHVCVARHEAIYLIARNTILSLPQIANMFGGRDHTSCFHAIRKHAARNGLPLPRGMQWPATGATKAKRYQEGGA